LSGERTPYNDPQARGALIGLTHNTGAAELAQAVLEGVAFAFAQGQQVIAHAGVAIDTVSVIGGGARSAYWGEILATALHRSLIYRQQAAIGGAYGAARLAWYCKHGGEFSAAFPMPAIEHIINPITANYSRFSTKQRVFDELYQPLKPAFNALREE